MMTTPQFEDLVHAAHYAYYEATTGNEWDDALQINADQDLAIREVVAVIMSAYEQ